jgi:hypothetical protein
VLLPWITGNRYLSMDEMKNNADIMHYFFKSNGWTDNAISAMFGNMQTESTLNPGIWENLDPFAGGYGLVQWTPYTNYSEWAGTDWQDNGQKEMERIIYELENHKQWISTSLYPMTFREFSQSDKPPAYLAQAFLYNYERPTVKPQPARSKQAEYWYQYITGHEPPISQLPIWLLFKMKERR